MNKLTIFTPTYNREKKLAIAYNSLINQLNKNFQWLIIDDGSTDSTENIVREWIEEGKIDIKYYKKNNGGKHSAYNFALGKIETEFVFLALDSDDVLYDDDVVDKILKELDTLKNDEVGMVTLCTSSRNGHNSFIKKYDCNLLNHNSLKWAYTNNVFDAECRMIIKSNYLNGFRYPEIEGENFFTEAYTYYQMDKPMKWVELNTCYSQYLEDGLTANVSKLFLNNPKSWYLYNKLRIKENKSFFRKRKYIIYYISFAILSNNKIFTNDILENLRFIIYYPFGKLGSLYIKRKGSI